MDITPARSATAHVTEHRLVGSDRVLAVLVEPAKFPEGVSLDEMARLVISPKPTVHRAFAALGRAGLAGKDGRGRSLLGDDFLRVAFANHETRPVRLRAQPILQRNPAHANGVGKMLLSLHLTTLQAVTEWVAKYPLHRVTTRTAGTALELHEQLSLARLGGSSGDDPENQDGVNCITVPAHLSSLNEPSGAISESALAHRTPLQRLIMVRPAIRSIVNGQVAGAPA